jgi:hypothetical protein
VSELHDLLPLVRKKVGEYIYPYGAFPDDDYEQQEGYEVEYYTPEEDDPTGERYRIEVLVSAEKLVPLYLDLCTLLPESICVALERASEDAYSRWDEFMSDEVPRLRFLELFRTYQFAFAEDGNLGLGAFSHDPPVEVFLGSHKELVVFSPDRKAVTDILHRHRVASCELETFYKRDHSHVPLTDYRGLRGPEFDYLHVAEVVRHALGMELQIDEDENVDEDGEPLGLVPWHVVAIVVPRRRARVPRKAAQAFVQEFGITAESRGEVRELLETKLERDGFELLSLEEMFRIDVERLPAHVRPRPAALAHPGIWFASEKTEADPYPG